MARNGTSIFFFSRWWDKQRRFSANKICFETMKKGEKRRKTETPTTKWRRRKLISSSAACRAWVLLCRTRRSASEWLKQGRHARCYLYCGDSATVLLNSSHWVLCSTYFCSYLYLKGVLVGWWGWWVEKKKDAAIRERWKIRQEADGGNNKATVRRKRDEEAEERWRYAHRGEAWQTDRNTDRQAGRQMERKAGK